MVWRLHVRFQEMELRDAFWEQVPGMPQLVPLVVARELRARLHMAQPVVVFEHNDRAVLAPLARWALDWWPSAQIELSRGGRGTGEEAEERREPAREWAIVERTHEKLRDKAADRPGTEELRDSLGHLPGEMTDSYQRKPHASAGR